MLFKFTPPDLKLLTDIFRRYKDIKAVYLFGSAASGKTHQESDLDLAVVPGSKEIRKQKLDILSDLARHGFCNVDLVILDKPDIVLLYEAVRQNFLVYQTHDFDRGEMYSRVVRQYLDFLPFLEVQRKAYKKRILNGKS